jgi:hypothetical protein
MQSGRHLPIFSWSSSIFRVKELTRLSFCWLRDSDPRDACRYLTYPLLPVSILAKQIEISKVTSYQDSQRSHLEVWGEVLMGGYLPHIADCLWFNALVVGWNTTHYELDATDADACETGLVS